MERTFARPTDWVRWFCLAALAASAGWALVATWHWPIVGDAPFMHYAVFLLGHGMEPYRQVVDVNLPGTYFFHSAAIHLIGPGAAAWRIFDFSLCTIAAIAMAVIARLKSRAGWPIAALFGGALFFLLHVRDGLIHTGQRDLILTALMLASYALLFHAVRKERLWQTGLFGALAGLASTVKPTALPWTLLLLAMACWTLRGRGQRYVGHLAAGLAGLSLAPLGALIYLLRHNALNAFLQGFGVLVPYHNSLGRLGIGALLSQMISSVLLPLVVLWLPLLVVTKPWREWEGLALFAGVGFGLISFILQGKGFPYHRYPSAAFLLLLIGIDFAHAMQRPRLPRILAATGLLLAAFFIAPVSASIAAKYDWRNQEFESLLTHDLQTAGARDGDVQCLDMTSGCLITLYNQRLVQATGILYDCYLFQPLPAPATVAYRREFWRQIHLKQPRVIVLSNQECFTDARSFRQLEHWPEFEAYLGKYYRLEVERTPEHTVGWWRRPARPYSYRFYIRKD